MDLWLLIKIFVSTVMDVYCNIISGCSAPSLELFSQLFGCDMQDPHNFVFSSLNLNSFNLQSI